MPTLTLQWYYSVVGCRRIAYERAILAKVTWFQHKIMAPIFKFINFEDDFKSLKLLFGVNWRTCYKTSTWPLGTNEYISPFFDCYPLHILNVLFWSIRVNAWDLKIWPRIDYKSTLRSTGISWLILDTSIKWLHVSFFEHDYMLREK